MYKPGVAQILLQIYYYCYEYKMTSHEWGSLLMANTNLILLALYYSTLVTTVAIIQSNFNPKVTL